VTLRRAPEQANREKTAPNDRDYNIWRQREGYNSVAFAVVQP